MLLDPTRLIQVLINLLTNAIKFTQLAARRVVTVGVAASKDRPKTGPQGTLFIPPGRQSRSGSNSIKNSPLKEELVGEPVFIHFWIEDSGRGLTEDESKLLFHRFSQATPRTHVQYGGSGLGLFISRELTELQGGQVGVLAKLGKGSTFAFYVKAARYISPRNSHPPSIKESVIKPLSTVSTAKKESKKKVGRETEPTPSPTTANLDVLIVEDNLINQKVMAAQLRRLGCRVHVANHGQEALTFLATTKWYTKAPKPAVDLNVVLMDLEMPVMDGLTCVAEIRRLQKTGEIKGHVPVIAVTANARDAQQNEAIRLGMDAIVTKPFRIPELIPKMNELASIESSRPEGPKFSLFRAV